MKPCFLGSSTSTCHQTRMSGSPMAAMAWFRSRKRSGFGQAGGRGQLHRSGDRVQGLEPLAHSPAVAAGLGLVRVSLDQVAVGLVALGLELAGQPAVADRRPRVETTAMAIISTHAAVLASASNGLRLHHRQ